MHSRVLTQGSVLAKVRISTLFFLGILLVLGSVGTTWAVGGIPWQVGDVVVCYGSGHCNVLRIHGTTVQLLDTLSDGLLGSTGGAALNNSLHLLATDDQGGGSSKVVVYSIASVNPFSGTPLTHNVISTFNGSSGPGSSAAAVAVNSAGHIFVGNSNPAGATIVELNASGTSTGNVFTLSGACATTTLASLDIGANADAIYVTAKDGVIRKVSLPLSPASSCSQFANFGSGVNLYGLKDIPAGALTGNCGASACPSDETVLVVAKGFTDPDASETEPPSPSDPDAVNICTNVADQNPVSCALLLDTNPNPGLNSPLWQAGNQYFTLNAPILDPSLHLQRVLTAGTSGGQEPTFNETGGTVIDNAAIWTDKGQPHWTANTPFTVTALPGTPYVVDSNFNLQTVAIAGTSGPTVPTWNTSGTTIDGLVWSDQGAWQANHVFALGSAVGDAAGHPHTVLTAGTSGSSLPVWNDSAGVTIDNAVTWTNQGAVMAYSGNHAFALNTLIVVGGHAQQAIEPGTSGGSMPSFSPVTGVRTIDNAVTWTDQGQEVWHPSFAFAAGAVVVDPAGHVQQVTTAGTSGATQPSFNDSGSSTTDGLQWTDQGQVLSWQADTAFSLHRVIADNNETPHFQQVVTAGTSGSATPSFSTNGGYTLDLASLSPPPVPATSSTTGGSFGDTTYFVEITYVNSFGETLPSPEVSTPVAMNNLLVVSSPAPSGSGADAASGYNVYVSTGPSGSETKQNSMLIPIGTDWTEPAGGLVSGASLPTTNTTVHSVVWIDLGPVASWIANTLFPLNSVIQDSHSHAQQATSGGTSGTSAPTFSTSGETINDNAVVWTDKNTLAWTADFAYNDSTAATTFVVDLAKHVQQATVPGTSGPGPLAPSFVDGGTTIDAAVVWTDQGRRFWYPGSAYSANAIVVDAVGHVQQVTTAGTSGSLQPAFKDGASPGGMVTDGLQWTDEGAPGSWTASASPVLNAVILDSNSHVQQVVAANGSSGSQQPTFSTSGGLTIDGSVVWIDRGAPSSWAAGTVYALNAVILDSNFPAHVQEATSAGTSGTSTPPFSSLGATVSDNAVMWTDEGLLSGSMFTWQIGHSYNVNDLIVDAANHQQQVTVAGTSGGSQPPFNDGGTVIDGLVWMDIGPTVSWMASTPFASGTLSVDSGSFLQKVTTAGISGTPEHPSWNESPLGNTVDGLQWTDQGYLVWQANHPFFTLGTLISDGAAHAQKVIEAGTSGSAVGFNDAGGTTIDNAVTWTESHPMWVMNHSYVTGNPDTLILDGNSHVQLVSTTGISGPTPPPFTSGHPLAGQTIDGLQWTNQASPATSVAARYPVTGVSTLQSLALDPLVATCTGNACSGLPLPTRKTSNFWLGDSVSGSFYKLNFATGSPITFTGACPTGCGIQSMLVYGGEGANQPGLASLVLNGSLNTGDAFTASANILQNSITSTLSNNGSGSPPTTAISLYASLVDKTSCFNDPSVGNLACKATVQADPTKALVWKLDVPLNGTTGLPTTETLNSSFASVGGFGIDNSTDVFVDEQFDDTTFVGTDPGTRTISVHSLHEVPVTFSQNTAKCTYLSPKQNGCYRTNRDELNFTFKCPGLTFTQFRNMHPTLSLVRKNPPQSPQFIPVVPPGQTPAYRFDDNVWNFEWDMDENGGPAPGTYQGTTFDTTGVQSFTVTFVVKKSCP